MAGKKGQHSQLNTDVGPRFSEDFLDELDGRVRVARTLRDRLRELTNDLGGVAQLSYQEASLCRRAIHLERQVERLESTLAHGGSVDYTQYFSMINTLSGLFSKIGLKRRAKQVQSLSEYLKDQSAQQSHNNGGNIS
jgi:hypothetical protein